MITQGTGIEIFTQKFIRAVREFWAIFFNPGRDNDYNTLTGQDMKLSSEPTWDSALISRRRMNKTLQDSVLNISKSS